MGVVRALGGAPLVGSNAVRFAHLDEAGTSKNEKYAIVAGIVSHADRQWKALNEYLVDLVADLVPPKYREGRILHAKDIFHGAKKWDRDVWPRSLRQRILIEVAKIPAKFDVPVVIGGVEKDGRGWEGDTAAIQAQNYALAFGLCSGGVEYFMRNWAEPNEVATIVAEDVPSMRRFAKEGHRILKDETLSWRDHPHVARSLPLTRIVEQPMFAAKDESSILQVADLLAFSLCRRAHGHSDVEFMIKEYVDQIIILPAFLDPLLRPLRTKPIGD